MPLRKARTGESGGIVWGPIPRGHNFQTFSEGAASARIGERGYRSRSPVRRIQSELFQPFSESSVMILVRVNMYDSGCQRLRDSW